MRKILSNPSTIPVVGMLKSVFSIRWHDTMLRKFNYGTMVAIRRRGKLIFITAKHVMPHLMSGGSFEVLSVKGWQLISVSNVFESNISTYDVIAFRISDDQSFGNVMQENSSISDGMDGLILGGPAVYMGYPASWLSNEDSYQEFYSNKMSFQEGFPYPVVKQTSLSYNQVVDEIPNLFLQGTANKGFSGAPVYTYKLNDKDSQNPFSRVLFGVIVKHKLDLTSIYDKKQNKVEAFQATSYADVSVAQPISMLLEENNIT